MQEIDEQFHNFVLRDVNGYINAKQIDVFVFFNVYG